VIAGFWDVGDVHHGVVASSPALNADQSDPESAAAPPGCSLPVMLVSVCSSRVASTQFWQLVHLATSIDQGPFLHALARHACCHLSTWTRQELGA